MPEPATTPGDDALSQLVAPLRDADLSQLELGTRLSYTHTQIVTSIRELTCRNVRNRADRQTEARPIAIPSFIYEKTHILFAVQRSYETPPEIVNKFYGGKNAAAAAIVATSLCLCRASNRRLFVCACAYVSNGPMFDFR